MDAKTDDRSQKTEGGALDVQTSQAVDQTDSSLKGRDADKADSIEADDISNLAARREAARLHGDVYIVKSDLEDQDQREASPGTREQD
ncbi:hypothetical protein BTR14_21215 [Rhizobium rhizosphaerae]|uniref:Uncharacterized protein n=1 Tax=Xaviernesmea rhizosphaerae TaxID=1672749 RepID=A0ABX3P7Q7_9HYPH|nr:hypothetical protein [Xaviernesmea rhizosphaerae]OQP83993.1 hypothetical protein BTR14_21215 [Xaviernesmea rhizosphaerae]